MGNSTSYTATINVQARIESAVANIKKIQTELDKLKLTPNLRTSFDTNFKNLYKEIEKYQDIIARGPKTKADSSALERSGNNILKIYNQIVKEMNSLDGSTLKNAFKDLGVQEVEKLKVEFENLKKTLGEVTAKSDFGKNLASSFEDAKKKIGDLNNEAGKLINKLGKTTFKTFSNNLFGGRFDLAENNLKSIQEQINKLDESVQGRQELVEWANNLSTAFEQLKNSGDISSFTEKLNELKGTLSSKQADVIQQLINDFSNLKNIAAGTGSEIEKITKDTSQLTNAQVQFNNEIGQLKSRIQYFFGLANAINLVKRAVRSSFNTVKELDKAMTETAVVTNYTIKDMWKQLPEYTKRANQLGVTTKAAYESATLYYQQGLNTEQAAALSTETLKMARIAGLDAADATDRMTNALRGFNMELNATQAQRVDDVYSQLAAMSASNVDEISTAMTKVASLANNANMEFETTAAFLAQIIETTRESAETAGTALKTVVARFSEVKKLYDTDQLKGQDEEGQVIDVNKVSAALRTAGIDLNKYFLGEVGLDDIFMELSEKWSSLTNIQQRYIATQAAGSRQQSRFIALMQDNARTQELVSAAYNANGASQKQFEKTQDSMESKLARLKNAWDEFAMGLANNAVLKGAVDILTNILQLVNKITNAFGDGVGSIMKWGALIGSLAGVRGIFKNGGFIDKAAGSFLNNTALGNILFKGGVLSGNLFGGATAANSTARQAVEEAARQGARSTVVTTGGLRGLFGNFRQRRAARLEAFNTYSAARGTVLDSDEFYNDLPGLGKLGLKASSSKLLGGISKKLAGTKFASGLGKLLGFGGTKAAAAAAAGLATALGAVAAAAGAVAIAYKAWYDLSPEGQLKSATKWAETMDKVSENAEKAKNSTKEAYEGYQEKNKAVETADTAISRQKAISERNQFINDLLQKDNTYAQYLKTSFDNKTGELVLTIDEADMQKVAQNAEEGAIKAAAGASLAQAMKAGAQANVYAAQMRRAGANIESKTIRYYDEKGTADIRAMTDAEIAKYSNLSLKQSQEKAAMEAYAKNAYARMVDSNKLSTEMADLVAGALAKTFDAKKYLKEIKDARNEASNVGAWWLRGREYWQEEYYKIYGTRADSSMKNADIASAVGEYKAQAEEEKKTAAVSKLAQQSQYEALFKALNGEVDINLQDDIDKYIEGFGDQLKQVADAMGLYEGDIYQQIKANAKAAKELQKSNLATLSAKALKAGASRDVWSTLLGLDKKDIAKVLDFSDAAEQSLGNGFGAFLDNIPYYIKQGQLDNIGDFFKSFDLNSPISAFKKLNTIAKDETSPILQELAKEVLRINESTFDQGYLTQVFMTSEAYEGISENLEKFIEENEEISAKNIEELAESCGDLKTLINDVGISAQGLALAFTAVGKGKASIDGITTSVLEALGASKNTTTAIDELFKRIDEFDAGRDFGKAVNFAYERIDELRESLTNLDFGNETFKKNYQHFFSDYEHFVNLDTEGRKSHLEQQIDWIEDLLDNDALGAMRELATKGIGVEQLGDYTFSWDVQGDWDTVAKQVADQLGVSNEIAETIMTAAAKHIPGLLDQMDLKGYENTIKTFNKNIANDTVITDQELQVLAEAYGKDIDTIYADMQKLSGGADIPIKISWQENGQNLTGVALIERFRSVEGAIHNIMSDFVGGSAQSGGRVDVDTILNKLQSEYKLSAAQATEIANNIVQSVNGKFTKSIQVPVEITDESGKGTGQWEIKKVQVSADTVEGLEAEIKLKEEQAQWTQMGQTIAQAIIDGIGEISINTEANESSLNSTRAAIEKALSGIVVTVSAQAGPIKTEGEAKGGYVSYASGSRKIKPGIALTGEEGPELVWNKEGGYAYLAGKNGPEFNNLRPGDQIFPADETKRIFARGETPSLARGGKVVPSYSKVEGDWNSDGSRKKEKGSGSGSNKDDEFKMDLDKYYNMVEDINELLRLRNLLETDYNQLLKIEGKTGKEIYDNLTKQLDLLEQRRIITEDLAEKRKQQIIDLVAENEELQKYAWWNNEDLTIEIDWDLVNGITDKDEGSKVKDYLSKLEDFQSKYDDMIENLEDIESTIQEIKERGKDEYKSLEDRTRDALIKQIQDKIDELTDVDKAITDTNQKLFDSINKTLQLQRQDRANEKTEEELGNKEKRLAYLQQDSSNANQVEIAKLQKEIDDARQDYTDNLIDQKISQLQEQNNEAQEQRQQQIELMQRSLDWQEKDGQFWNEAYRLISEGTDATGALIHKSDLENVLKGSEGWAGLSDEGKMDWLKTLEDQVAQGIAYLEQSRQLEVLGTKEGTQISFTNAKGERLTGTVDKDGNVVVKNKDGSTITYKDVFQDYYGNYRTFEGSGETKTAPKPATNTAKPTTKPTAATTGGSSSNKDRKDSDTSGHKIGDVWYTYASDETCMKHTMTKDGVKNSAQGHVKEAVPGAPSGIKRCKNCLHVFETSTASASNLNGGTQNTTINESVTRPIGRTNKKIGEGTASIPKAKRLESSTQERMTDKELNDLIDSNIDEFNNLVYPTTTKVTGTHGKKVGTGTASVPTSKSSNNNTSNITKKEEEEKKKWTLLDGIKAAFRGSFDTGGLADFTGPAWLDGTRSHPELILNARDTQNFIELKDVLTNLKSNGGFNLSGGDNYYDIKVQVDSLGSDYDVDRAIDRIKARLAQDGAYRNVNTLSRLR